MKFILFIVVIIIAIFGIVKAISIYQDKKAVDEIKDSIIVDTPHITDAPNMNNE